MRGDEKMPRKINGMQRHTIMQNDILWCSTSLSFGYVPLDVHPLNEIWAIDRPQFIDQVNNWMESRKAELAAAK